MVYHSNPWPTKSTKATVTHGLALIISNEEFDSPTLSDRKCAPCDSRRLQATLHGLGYRVRCATNQTAHEIKMLLNSISKNSDPELHIEEGDDSFVCCIGTHGGWDKDKEVDFIHGTDGGKVYLQKEVYEKLNACVCTALNGKPKLFFVQACRGEHLGKPAGEIKHDSAQIYQLPRESDFFISYSTAPETKSFRVDPDSIMMDIDSPINITPTMQSKPGSFYITELCDSLKKYAPCLDLMSIVLSVHQMIQALMDPIELHTSGGKVTTRQCPHLLTSLRGPVFFYSQASTLHEKHIKECIKKTK